MVIMGPPGCGKSAILRVLNGVWRHSQGSITKPSGLYIFRSKYIDRYILFYFYNINLYIVY